MDNHSFNPSYQPYPSQATSQNLAPQNPGQQAGSGQHGQPGQQQQPPALASFGSLSAHGQQQGQQQPQTQSPSNTTLPPLQGQNGYHQFGSMSYTHPGSASQTPTTPHAPPNGTMAGNASSDYVQYMSPSNTTTPGSMLPPNFPNNPYGNMSQSMMYPSSTSTAMPPVSSSVGLPTIRPMPPGGVTGVNGLPSLASAGQLGLGQHPSFMQSEEQPTHVVGSQGRRGILPSAPGRPNPPAQGSTQATKSMIPQKDADGKYPCPHCNKTYLHAKHLKRHLLRHTGDRPYMCHLCKDTFSRSDILKRHFQKCSLRRGNPTGANHLAHQRRNTNSNRLSIGQQDGPIGLASMQDVSGGSGYNAGVAGNSPTVNGDLSARSSRANSLISPGNMSHRNSLAGLGILGSNAPNADQMNNASGPYQPGMNAFAMQNNANGAQMQGNYTYSQVPQLNGHIFNNGQVPHQQPQQQQQQQPPQMSFLGHPSSRFNNSQANDHQQMPNGDGNGVDWTRMFTQGGQDGFINSQTGNASSHGAALNKTETDAKPDFSSAQHDFSNDSFLGSLYSHPGGLGPEDASAGIPGFPQWGDPLQAKAESLLHHCFPRGIDSIQGDPAAELMHSVLDVASIKHFAEHYTSYHGHWPILHMPTFQVSKANNNLILAIICIGAVYSPKLSVHQVRQMMEFVRATVASNCTLYTQYATGLPQGHRPQPFEVEELQALTMLHILFTWHGDPSQRQAARGEFPKLVTIAKNMDLCRSAPAGHYAHSILHDTHGLVPSDTHLSSWDWHRWLEQEKRNRAIYQLFLTDAAMVMYFNCPAQIDPFEIRLMLPADDAAWDASTAQECACALGLTGTHAQNNNIHGTRKVIQPSMRDAMRTLLDPHAMFQPSATNVYSKFLLVHALILRIVACQKALFQPDGTFQGFNISLTSSTPATPLSQNEWLEQNGGSSGNRSANNSGSVTPIDAISPNGQQNAAAQQEKKRLGHGLDKWKRNWDHDMELQYPPSQYQPKRFGFVRDGVHFFYLGRSFLQQPTTDFSLPGDLRFKRVLALLKRIRSQVVGDSQTKGQDLGSVSDIDEQYGLDSLTLDMKLLFKPHNSQLDSPITGLLTHS